MKKIIVFNYLLFPLIGFSQYTPQEIKKYKISKIIIFSANSDSSETQTTGTLYDRNGNDTATLMDGQLYQHSQYKYDAKNKTLKRIVYDHDGSENATAVYNYKPDGSYIVSNTDKQFGMIDYTHFDKTGKIIKTISPDRAERLYTYDASGKLLRIKTKPGGNGVLVDIQDTYNPKGQLVKEVSKGEFKWTTTYSYDAKGLITKAVRTSSEGGTETTKYYSYQYEFWK